VHHCDSLWYDSYVRTNTYRKGTSGYNMYTTIPLYTAHLLFTKYGHVQVDGLPCYVSSKVYVRTAACYIWVSISVAYTFPHLNGTGVITVQRTKKHIVPCKV
jgi:hypothetical protein